MKVPARPRPVAAAITLRTASDGACAGTPYTDHTCPHNASPTGRHGRCYPCQLEWNRWRKEVRDMRRAAGQCPTCGTPNSTEHVLCPACLADRRAWAAVNRAGKRQDRLFALLGTLRGRRQQWAFWVLAQLGYELDERHYLTAGPPEPVDPPYTGISTEPMVRTYEYRAADIVIDGVPHPYVTDFDYAAAEARLMR